VSEKKKGEKREGDKKTEVLRLVCRQKGDRGFRKERWGKRGVKKGK